MYGLSSMLLETEIFLAWWDFQSTTIVPEGATVIIGRYVDRCHLC